MSLRIQTSGKQKNWTLEDLRSGLQEFYKENGRYPTATEVNSYKYLPAARSIERQYGGLVQLRQKLGLGGQTDYRSGAHSINRAHFINNRAHESETEVYKYLCGKFGRELVHREYFFTDDARTRADFFVFDRAGNFCVDVFFPADLHNLTGCINIKLKKYHSITLLENSPVIFLMMNPDIAQEKVDTLIKNKKQKLESGEQVMTWTSFKNFCQDRPRLHVR